MSGSTRKRWATKFDSALAEIKKQPSRKAAYEYVVQQREQWQRGGLRWSQMVVYVDEGRGWQLYERVDLAA